MNNFLRFFILFLGLSCSFTIIKLLVKKEIAERISLLWLVGSLLILIVSIAPSILDRLSNLVGIDYPPSLLFLLSTVILLLVCFFHSIQISTLNSQIRELTQQVAIKEAQYNNEMDLKYKEIIKVEQISKEEVIEKNESN